MGGGFVESVEKLAIKVWGLSRDRLLIHLRFLDVALSSIEFRSQPGIGQVLCNIGSSIYPPLVVT